MASRLKNKWTTENRYMPIIIDPTNELLQIYDQQSQKNKNEDSPLWQNCIEVIFEFNEDKSYTIHFISRFLDGETLEFVESPFMEGHYESKEEVKFVLGLGMGRNIPIYPENNKCEKELISLQEEIISKGVIYEGKKMYVKDISKIDYSKIDSVLDLNSNRIIYKGQVSLVNKSISLRNKIAFDLISQAQRDLSEALKSDSRNEHELQRVIVRHPILFGTEYINIHPKHKLGSEYEMDFALERFDGTYDLVEIEASNLELFTKSGDPRKELTHAEQQVLDWLTWISEKNFYAREKLDKIVYPKGVVVIGRNSSLDKKRKLKLLMRNKLYQGKITIYTYDDLLARVDSMKNHLFRVNDYE